MDVALANKTSSDISLQALPETFAATGERALALQDLRTAHAAAPDDPEIALRLGQMLCERSDRPSCVAEYLYRAESRRAALTAFENRGTLNLEQQHELALLLLRHACAPQALAVVAAANAAAPGDFSGHLLAAEIYYGLGDRAHALVECRSAIAANPESALPYLLLTKLADGHEEGADAFDTLIRMRDARLLQWASRDPGMLREARIIDAALGAICEKRGEYRRAYEFYRARDTLPLVSGQQCLKVIELMQAQKQRYGKEALAAPGVGCPSAAPVFMVGLPRSGGTLLEELLLRYRDGSGNPRIVSVGESADLPHFSRLLERGEGDEAKQLADAYLTRIAEAAGGSLDGMYVLNRHPANVMHVGLARTLFPAARFVFYQRDLLDSWWSIYTREFADPPAYSGCFAAIVEYYNRAHRPLVQHWQDCLPAELIHTVRYEDLVRKPEETLSALTQFLQLEPDPAIASRSAALRFRSTEPRAGEKIYGSAIGRAEPFKGFLMAEWDRIARPHRP